MEETVNQKELSELLREKGYTAREAIQIIKDFTEVVSESLCEGKAVVLRGFGKFIVKESKNPFSKCSGGEKTYRRVCFSPFDKLKKGV